MIGALLALFISIPAFSQGGGQMLSEESEAFDIPFAGDCGLVTRYASNRISPACLTQSLNILYDEDMTLKRRLGQSKYNSSPCTDSKSVRGLWPFDATDSTHYLVINSSQTFFKTSGSGDCTFIPGLNNLSATADWSCVQTIGKLWCVNGVDTPFSWDGASTSPVSGMPNGTLIGAFRNRVVVAGVNGQLTRIRLSGELDGTDWTLLIPGRSTSPASIDISGTNDGNKVTCLMGQYQDTYLIGRDRDLFGLYGNDRRDFTLRKLNGEIGCIENRSVQEKNNTKIWMSRRGIERLTGTTITRASDAIRPDIDTIITAGGNSQSKTFSSQSDFQGGSSNAQASGSLAPVSTTISPNDVIVASNPVIMPDFRLAATTFVSTAPLSGLLSLTISTFQFSNGDFHLGNTSGWSGPTVVNTNASFPVNPICSGDTGTNAALLECGASGNTTTIQTAVFESQSSVLISSCSTTWTFGTGVTATTCRNGIAFNCSGSFPVAQCAFKVEQGHSNVYYGINSSGGGGGLPSNLTNFLADNAVTALGDYNTSTLVSGCTAAKNRALLFRTCNTRNFESAGVSTSAVIDTFFSTPTFGAVSIIGSTSPAAVLNISMAVSNDGVTFDNAVPLLNGLKPTANQKRYLKIISNFSTTDPINPPSITSFTLPVETTGYYITDCVNPGTPITSWGSLKATYQNNGGSLAFYISTGTSCNQVTRTTATWNLQSINSPITIATAPFTAARILFNIDSATQTPTLNDITWEWNAGGGRPPVASAVYRDRYHLFYTTSTAVGSFNDHDFVLDQNDKWAQFNGISAYSATLYNNRLYTGDSQATGTIYQQDVGNDDAGAGFTMTFKTPDMDFGAPNQLKTFKYLYAMLKSEETQNQNIGINFSYKVDGGTNTYSLGSCNMAEATEPGYFTCKLPFPLSNVVDGRWISIMGSYNGDQGPVRIYDLRLIFTRKEID